MIFTMLVALAQIAFVPGFLCANLLLSKETLFERLLFTFPLSLLCNYILVVFLIFLGIYRQESLYIVFVAESVLLLVWIFKKQPNTARRVTIEEFCSNSLALQRNSINGMTSGQSLLQKGFLWLAYFLALLSIGFAIKLFGANLGSIFLDNDAVAAYNKWAEVIAMGRISPSSYYPLLIPVSWSLSYVFFGEPLQFVAKAIMPLFFLNTLVACLHLGMVRKLPAYVFSVPLIAWFFVRYLSGYIVEGSMDVAVASFCALGIYAATRAVGDGEKNIRFLIVGALVAIEASLTKQAGLFVAAIFPALCFVMESQRGKRDLVTSVQVLRYFGLYLFLGLSFYIYRWILIQQGTDVSYVNWLVGGIHEGRGFIQRLVYAWHLVADGRYTRVIIAGLLMLLAFSLWHKQLRWITMLMLIPFTAIWATAFSYDIRNWAIGMMCFALGAAGGVDVVWRYMRGETLLKLKVKYVLYVLFAFFLLVIGVGTLTISRERLRELEAAKMRQIGNPELNNAVFSYIDKHPLEGNVLTAFNYLKLLPEVGGKFIPIGLNLVADSDLAQFNEKMENPEIAYLLIPSFSSMEGAPEIRRVIQARIDSGEYQVIFANQWLFIKKIRKEKGLSSERNAT